MDLEAFGEIDETWFCFQAFDGGAGVRFRFVGSDQKFDVLGFGPFLDEPQEVYPPARLGLGPRRSAFLLLGIHSLSPTRLAGAAAGTGQANRGRNIYFFRMLLKPSCSSFFLAASADLADW